VVCAPPGVDSTGANFSDASTTIELMEQTERGDQAWDCADFGEECFAPPCVPDDSFDSFSAGDSFDSFSPSDSFDSFSPGDSFDSFSPGDSFDSFSPGDSFDSFSPGDFFDSFSAGDFFDSFPPDDSFPFFPGRRLLSIGGGWPSHGKGLDAFSPVFAQPSVAASPFTFVNVNKRPSFVGAAISGVVPGERLELDHWAREIHAGIMEDGTPVTAENDQKLSFHVTTDRPLFVVFSEAPTVTPDGNLSFTLLPGVSGVVPIRVVLTDDGGKAHWGVDTSYEYVLTINAVADADAPRLIELTTDGVTLHENAARTYFPGIVMASRGVFADYRKKFSMATSVAAEFAKYFSTPPGIDKNGVLSFQPAPNVFGDVP
ncbi:hypothetical protein T484DRAFT_1769283, partial [Baffinella frigidus]